MKRSPIRPVSAKRARENRERRKMLKEIIGGPCRARLSVCTGKAQDGHEVLSRARGGSITDRKNVLGVCRACHDWIGDHPAEAAERGLLRHSWSEA